MTNVEIRVIPTQRGINEMAQIRNKIIEGAEAGLKVLRVLALYKVIKVMPKTKEEEKELSKGKVLMPEERAGQIVGVPTGGRFLKESGQRYIEDVLTEEKRKKPKITRTGTLRFILITTGIGERQELEKTGYSWKRTGKEDTSMKSSPPGWNAWNVFEYGGHYYISPRADNIKKILSPESGIFVLYMEKSIKARRSMRKAREEILVKKAPKVTINKIKSSLKELAWIR